MLLRGSVNWSSGGCLRAVTFSTIVPTRSIHPFSARPSSQTSHASPGPSQTSHPRPDTMSPPPVAGPGRVPPEEQPRGHQAIRKPSASEPVSTREVVRWVQAPAAGQARGEGVDRRLHREQASGLGGSPGSRSHDDLRAVGRTAFAAPPTDCGAGPLRRVGARAEVRAPPRVPHRSEKCHPRLEVPPCTSPTSARWNLTPRYVA